MSTHTPRIAPIPVTEWGDAEKDALAVFVRADDKNIKGDNSDKGKEDMSALGILLVHPALAKAMFALSRHLLYDNELAARDRELLILRLAWHRKAEYEWVQHVIIGQTVGISDEEISRITQADIGPAWSDKDRLLITAADELIADALLTDTTWKGLQQHFNTHELMEVMVTVGAYDTIAMVFNSCGLQLTDELRGVIEKYPLQS